MPVASARPYVVGAVQRGVAGVRGGPGLRVARGDVEVVARLRCGCEERLDGRCGGRLAAREDEHRHVAREQLLRRGSRERGGGEDGGGEHGR